MSNLGLIWNKGHIGIIWAQFRYTSIPLMNSLWIIKRLSFNSLITKIQALVCLGQGHIDYRSPFHWEISFQGQNSVLHDSLSKTWLQTHLSKGCSYSSVTIWVNINKCFILLGKTMIPKILMITSLFIIIKFIKSALLNMIDAESVCTQKPCLMLKT